MDIEKRNNLILNNLKLVHYQYNRKFSSLPIEKEDIISIGILGLIKAIDNYDKEKGYTFSTYALKCIDNEILQGVKKNKSLANINLEDIIYEDISYADVISDNINIEEEYLYNEIVFKDGCLISLQDDIRDIISKLNEKDRYIYELYFKSLLSQKEIAKKTNISQAYVSRKINKIIDIVETTLENRRLIEKSKTKKKKIGYNKANVL